jgi:hypothetical protein
MGKVTLMEALELTALVVLKDKDPGRRSRFAARWLQRLLDAPGVDDRGGGLGLLRRLLHLVTRATTTPPRRLFDLQADGGISRERRVIDTSGSRRTRRPSGWL